MRNIYKKSSIFLSIFIILIFLPAANIFAEKINALKSNNAFDYFSADRPLKVLFIGNSYTYVNNLPDMLAGLAASAGTPMETKMIAEGGATLQDHWEKGLALKAIHETTWDYVILQEQSELGATYIVNGENRITDPQYLYKYARLFDKEIKKSGAQTIFYSTWARRNSPKTDQATLNYAYMSIAGELKDKIAPVGIAWQEIRRKDPKLELYIEDKSHPKDAGTYIAACMFYAAIYGKSPVGLSHNISGNQIDIDGNIDTKKEVPLVNITDSEAGLIQRTTWETYQKIKAAGGYLSIQKPPMPLLPKLPAGRMPAVKDLEGSWTGRLNFYPVPWPATMELKLHQEKGEWKAELKIRFEGNPNADKTLPVKDFRITKTGIDFIDAKGISGSPVKYTAAFTGKNLSGISEVKISGSPVYAIGTWKLERQN